MISAQAADAHRFGRVKRNGYDPAEVDAVVARLVDTLGAYERTTATLEERLEEADVSADAIRRTFIAAEQTRDEILEAAQEQARTVADDAAAEADAIVADARLHAAKELAYAEQEVTALADLANRLDEDMTSTRAALLDAAEREAQAVLEAAEVAAADRTIASAAQAQNEITAAIAEIEDEHRRTGLAAQAASMSAAWIRREATTASQATLADAKARAEQILAEAERERSAILEHVDTLRSALHALDASAAQLAAVTAARGAVIDLAEIERLEGGDIDLSAVDLTEIEAMEPIESPPPEVEGGRLDEPRHLHTVASVPEPATIEDPEPAAAAPNVRSDDEPTTYYQRSTGIPLSERVRLARRSG